MFSTGFAGTKTFIKRTQVFKGTTAPAEIEINQVIGEDIIHSRAVAHQPVKVFLITKTALVQGVELRNKAGLHYPIPSPPCSGRYP